MIGLLDATNYFNYCFCNFFQGNEILSGLSQDEYESMIGLLEAAILATDLALYFK